MTQKRIQALDYLFVGCTLNLCGIGGNIPALLSFLDISPTTVQYVNDSKHLEWCFDLDPLQDKTV